MFCAQCGEHLADGDLFCSNCGQAVENHRVDSPISATPIPSVTPPVTAPLPSPRKTSTKPSVASRITAVFASIVIFLMTFVSLTCTVVRTTISESTVKDVLSEIDIEDILVYFAIDTKEQFGVSSKYIEQVYERVDVVEKLHIAENFVNYMNGDDPVPVSKREVRELVDETCEALDDMNGLDVTFLIRQKISNYFEDGDGAALIDLVTDPEAMELEMRKMNIAEIDLMLDIIDESKSGISHTMPVAIVCGVTAVGLIVLRFFLLKRSGRSLVISGVAVVSAATLVLIGGIVLNVLSDLLINAVTSLMPEMFRGLESVVVSGVDAVIANVFADAVIFLVIGVVIIGAGIGYGIWRRRQTAL